MVGDVQLPLLLTNHLKPTYKNKHTLMVCVVVVLFSQLTSTPIPHVVYTNHELTTTVPTSTSLSNHPTLIRVHYQLLGYILKLNKTSVVMLLPGYAVQSATTEVLDNQVDRM